MDDTDADAPPRNEGEYLAHRIRELERANRRWKRSVLAAVAAAFLFFLLTGGFILLRLARARAAEMMARQAAEEALRQAEQTRQQLEAGSKGR
jgi:hypothetical protein